LSGARHHPRVALALRAALALPDGSTFEARTDNVSCAGFQVRAPREAVACLFPDGHQPTPRSRQEARVVLRADADTAQPVVIRVRCAAVVARRVAETEFQVGFQFLDLAPQDLRWLEARIASGLRKGIHS
jgi:hypothetical protein